MLIYFVYKKIIYNFALNLMEYVLLNIKNKRCILFTVK